MAQFNLGRTLAYILRHNPTSAGLTLDEHGWVDIDALAEGISKTRPVTKDMIIECARLDGKSRYAISDDGKKIRARQGHSLPVDAELETREPPEILYHGTAEKFVCSILEKGLLPMSRMFVHLSWDKETAFAVGSRHGEAKVLGIRALDMAKDGYTFYLSENSVWNTKSVPKEYLWLIED